MRRFDLGRHRRRRRRGRWRGRGRCDCTSRLPARHEDPHHARQHVAYVERHADGRVHEQLDRLLDRLLVVGHVSAPDSNDGQSTVPDTMSVLEALLVLGAGFLAGTINTIVGSGSLITFPTLLAIGYSPVVANVSNTVGITFGSMSGAVGYRRELGGQRRRATVLGTASLVGGITGGVLLLTLPSSVFDDVVPVLILLAVVLVILQPRLSRLVAERRSRVVEHGGVELWIGIFLTGVYGGYFGAAQGVILLSLLGIFIADTCSGSTR